jgi:cell division protease FtsH
MSVIVPESALPQQLSVEGAVEAAYAQTLAEIASDLVRGLPVLVECDKDLAPHVFVNLRSRLKQRDLKCLYLDGRPREGQTQEVSCGLVAMMIGQLRDAVRGAVEKRVVVLPHLDLLTTSQGGLTAEAREVIPLLYENPELVWLGFKDPSFSLPRVIEGLFPHRYSLLGVPRRGCAIGDAERVRKFGRQFNPWALYKYVSGMNAARLRRLLGHAGRRRLSGRSAPGLSANPPRHQRRPTRSPACRPGPRFRRLRQSERAACGPRFSTSRAQGPAHRPEEIARLESLIPRGMIFWGPPGTGKTLFAKAMATAIGAAITVVSGPELKSRWVGESEENLRQIFHKARQSAPGDYCLRRARFVRFGRGTYTGSGVEHSMVNQLLTEMDGFHSDEMVFVVGTTNFVEILDPALLRPGRFEFHLHIPYPDADDRRAILQIYNAKMRLAMSDDALEFAVRRTGDFVEGAAPGTRFSGDHINALCRALARIRLREHVDGPQRRPTSTGR